MQIIAVVFLTRMGKAASSLKTSVAGLTRARIFAAAMPSVTRPAKHWTSVGSIRPKAEKN